MADLHAGLGDSRAQDAQIPAAPTALHHQPDDFLSPQAPGEFEAGLAGLRDLEAEAIRAVADFPDVADADFVIGESGEGKIFAESAVRKDRECPSRSRQIG